MKTYTHPLILKAAKVCKDCGYKMSAATTKSLVDSHTKQRITTSKVVFSHESPDKPFLMHKFIKDNLKPKFVGNHTDYITPTGEVSLQVNRTPVGHTLVFHSVRISK